MRFIHCADIHLDSKLTTNLSPEQAKERNTEILGTFTRMVDYAVKNKVTAILMSGDIFDTQRVSSATLDMFLNTIRYAADVDFLYLKGNHDELQNAFMDREIPDNLKMFSSAGWTSYEYGNVVVSGIELSDANYSDCYDRLWLHRENVNIVMMHGQLDTRTGRDSVCLNRLKNKGIDYLALGHIHSYAEGTLDERGTYCYPGCLEGRGYDETGAKGYVLVNVESGLVSTQFRAEARRQIYEENVDIGDCVSLSDVIARVRELLEDYPDTSIIRVNLTGECDINLEKDIDTITGMLKSKVYHLEVADKTHIRLEPADYLKDVSLKGAFLRQVMSADIPESDREKIARAGVEAITGAHLSL